MLGTLVTQSVNAAQLLAALAAVIFAITAIVALWSKVAAPVEVIFGLFCIGLVSLSLAIMWGVGIL